MNKIKPRIIPVSRTARQIPEWQRALADAIDRPADLFAVLGLAQADLGDDLAAHLDFPLRVPRSYVARMRLGDPRDPLLRQVLPLGAELDIVPGFDRDPVGDLAASKAPGLLHKYQGRALLITTGACAIHCRYCFRRHFPYGEHARSALDQAINAIAADPGITEVILSGGDPLSLNDDRLADIEKRVSAIPHVRRMRIHTRLPIVLPERVDDTLLSWLNASRLQKVMVLHANHGNEIDTHVKAAARRLHEAGCTLLNQSVLLRGINDDASSLQTLSEALFDAGILPYYVHQLDRVAGAAHFEVSDREALNLWHDLSARVPGYLLPRLVREHAGAHSKTPLHPVG
ncbi:MAG: EF-P beta-lysylation protein EpmB [Gammaproteobacteria bacterium]|nr:EF-P beta-lysylation protein EpmB [Gammaproteobacteria bacterium]MCP5137309.1 EF-P beta-lysylation protein EpmB [Gammaproteobacteria bacterium]